MIALHVRTSYGGECDRKRARQEGRHRLDRRDVGFRLPTMVHDLEAMRVACDHCKTMSLYGVGGTCLRVLLPRSASEFESIGCIFGGTHPYWSSWKQTRRRALTESAACWIEVGIAGPSYARLYVQGSQGSRAVLLV